jgi:FtsZ-binding cell division protein ZapB
LCETQKTRRDYSGTHRQSQNQKAKITPVLQDALKDKEEVYEDAMATNEHKKNTQPSHLERLEMKVDQMLNAVAFLQQQQEEHNEESLKQSKDNLSTAASSLDHASKKADTRC